MAKGMNRAELNEAVAKSMDCSKAQADRAVGSVLESIQKGLKRQGEVSIVGFGTFRVKKRKVSSVSLRTISVSPRDVTSRVNRAWTLPQ